MADPTALRAQLGQAIAARGEAEGVLEKATAAVSRGEAIESEAQTEFDKFADLDQRIIDARAQRIAHWARGTAGLGRAMPECLFDIGEELIEARSLRDEARERLTAATDAVVILRRAANAAQAAFTAAKDRCTFLVAEVLADIANGLGEELAEMKRKTWRLEDKLAALVEVWPGGARLRCSPAVGVALELTRERYDGDRRPGMPFGREYHAALWQELLARLQNDASAEWQHRPPRPEDRKTIIARPGAPSFVPASLAYARRLEAERAEAEAAAAAATAPPPFVPEAAWTAAQKFRHEKAERDATAELVERAEAEARQGSV
jgi:hypothetical protein